MPMPKAPVNEYSRSVLRKHDVRTTWKRAHPKAKSESTSVEMAADGNFRCGIASTNAGHHPASCLAIDYVGHHTVASASSG